MTLFIERSDFIREETSSMAVGSIVCVQTGNFATAQGTLVWEKDDMACIRVFSTHIVGRRITANPSCIS
ncbi:hypothetical protein ABMC89_15055 [Sulfitobacter sp. HNIBRBA3233]|uniref:hypothetical protein n=1 Tax=Sulfitobacter marinivivus TaxID=3158558 RepID=UPI0032E0116F